MRLILRVCGARLASRADGLARPHGRANDCPGVGYRLARWPVGQRLRHHTTGVWEVVEDREQSTRWGDYVIRCVAPTRTVLGGLHEEPGTEVIVHGEYLHRHGWTPVGEDAS